jgi:HPt (histidine-containing phosphotransfer) domain-containing protein
MLIDVEVLEQLGLDTSPELVPRMLGIFIDELRNRSAAIAAAEQAADITALGREAHAIKSSADTYGAPELALAARRIDQACKDGDLAAARRSARAFSELVEPTIGELNAYLGET